MTGAILLLVIGILMVFGGFVGTLPESLDPSWRRPDDFDRGEEMGSYIVMAMGGFLAAAGVAVLLAAWLDDPDDASLGAIVAFAGLSSSWLWFYNRLYRRLRRPESTSRLAGAIDSLGRIGGRVGPPLIAAGVVVSIVQ